MNSKKIAYIVFAVALLSGFEVNAQITRTILGVTLGITSEHEIKSILPEGKTQHHQRSYTFRVPAYNTFDLNTISFAGVKWDYVSFGFKDGMVTEVTFKSTYAPYIDEVALNNRFNSIYSALKSKYRKYEKESLRPDFRYFTDNELSITIRRDNSSCSLSYSLSNPFDLYVELGYLKENGVNSSEL